MAEYVLTDDTRELVAVTFVFKSRAELAERFENFEASRTNLETLIDNVGDHNQLMLDAIEDVDPAFREVIEALMHAEDDANLDDATGNSFRDVWVEIVDDLFDRAKRVCQEVSDRSDD